MGAGRNAGRKQDVPRIVQEVVDAPGRSLDAETRALFERRFGNDFSRVRVHTDARASKSARMVGARAYTVGQHIAFDAGRFAPSEPSGQRLLAHELTHTVQQAATSAHRVDGASDGRLEDQAARAAHGIMGSVRGIPMPSRVSGPGGVLQRDRETTIARALHPEETRVFSGSIRLPNQGVLFYSIELTNMPPLLPWGVELECQDGVVAAVRHLTRSGPLPRTLPNMRLRVDAGYSRVLRPGHLTRLVRLAARRELKRAVADATAQESVRAPDATSSRPEVPFLEALGEVALGTFVPALEGAKGLIPGGGHQQPVAEEAFEEPEPQAEEEVASPEAAEVVDVAEGCDEDDPDYARCVREEIQGNYRRGIRAAGEVATLAAEVAFPVQSALYGPRPESSGDPGVLANLPKVGRISRLSRLLSRTANIKTPRLLVARRRLGSTDVLDPRIMDAVRTYRSGPGRAAFGRNFGAARVRLKDGTTKIIKAINVPGGTHAEEEILGVIDEIRAAGHDPAKVRVEQIFSERIPCMNCMKEVIQKHIGTDVDVFYFLAEAEGPFFRGRKLKSLYY
jgi:hypothetical protein